MRFAPNQFAGRDDGDGQSRIESREGRRVAAACCATADTVPFRLFEALLRSVCVVFIEGAEYRIDLGFGLQLPCVDEVNTGSV